MTKETKIGLLVGLAFIIVFAVILSEKGSPSRSDKPIFSTADGAGGHKGGDGAAMTDGRLPLENRLSDIVKPDPNASAANAMPEEPINSLASDTGDVELPKLPDSLQDILNMPIARGPSVEQTPPTGSSMSGQGLPSTERSESTIDPSQRALADASRSTPPTITHDGTTRDPVSIPPGESLAMHREGTTPSPGPTANPTPPPAAYTIKTTHTVQSGESIGKIAAKYYGRATPARIKALFDANRETLSSVNQVRADTTLKIPMLSDTEPGFEAAPDFALAKEFAEVPGRNPDGGIRIPRSLPDSGTSTARDNANRKLADNTAGSRLTSPAEATARSTTNTEAARRAVEPPRVAVRWYEVADKDTLSRIARRELGDERRANEIWKLNRDRLASKHKLKRGIKLRLPSDEPSSQMPISTATHVEAPGVE